MFNPKEYFCFCGIEELTFSSFSSVQEVGIGLFLGIAILQLIGSGGIADLARRLKSLETTINKNTLNSLREEANRIKADLAKLEITLHKISYQIFSLVLILLLIGLTFLTFSTLNSDATLTCLGSYLILSYFLLLPVLVFLTASLWIRNRCAAVRNAIKSCENKVNQIFLTKKKP